MNAPAACGSSFAGIGLEILPRKSLRNTSLCRLSIVFSGQHAGKLPSSKTAPLRHQCLRWPYWNVPARHCSNLWTISGLRHEYKPWSTSLSDMTDQLEQAAVASCFAGAEVGWATPPVSWSPLQTPFPLADVPMHASPRPGLSSRSRQRVSRRACKSRDVSLALRSLNWLAGASGNAAKFDACAWVCEPTAGGESRRHWN